MALGTYAALAYTRAANAAELAPGVDDHGLEVVEVALHPGHLAKHGGLNGAARQ